MRWRLQALVVGCPRLGSGRAFFVAVLRNVWFVCFGWGFKQVIGVFDFNSEIWALMNSVSYDSVEQHLDAS